MTKRILKFITVIFITTALTADTSYLFCLEVKSSNHYPVQNIIDIVHKEHHDSQGDKDSGDSHNHHDPFHHLHHSSQISPPANFYTKYLDTDTYILQEIPDETVSVYLVHGNKSQLLYFQQKFRFRSSPGDLTMLSVLLI